MFKNILIEKAKEYGKNLLHTNVKSDLNSVYYIAQGFANGLTPAKKTFAKNALDFLRNSIFEVAKMNKPEISDKDKIIIDAEFEVKNKK